MVTGMTRAQLRDAIAGATNRADKTNLINTAINLALREIGSRHDFRELKDEQDVSIQVNEQSIAVPGTFHQIIEARLINGTLSYPIEIRTKGWFVQRFPSPTTAPAAEPAYGYEEGGLLYFQAPAYAARTIRLTLYSLPADLLNDTDRCMIGYLDNAITSWGCAFVHRSLQMYQEAQYWMLEYERALRIAMAADIRKTGAIVTTDAYSTHDRRGGNPLDPFNMQSNSSPSGQ
jgi:hypothetical protein